MADKVFQYIVLHQSLLNDPGLAATQSAHAAVEGALCVGSPSPEFVRECHRGILVAPDEETILRVAKELHAAGVPCSVIFEPDEPYNGAATAVATSIGYKSAMAPFFEGLKVFRKTRAPKSHDDEAHHVPVAQLAERSVVTEGSEVRSLPGTPRSTYISINGRVTEIPADVEELGYDEVVRAAGFDPARVLSVVWQYKEVDRTAGTLTRSSGKTVKVKNGLVLDVADTSNA